MMEALSWLTLAILVLCGLKAVIGFRWPWEGR